MKVYKLEVIVIDHDDVGDEMKDILENQKYPNWCLSPHVIKMESIDIGEWDDDHPLNNKRLFSSYIRNIFPNPALKLQHLRSKLKRVLGTDGCFDSNCILRDNKGMVTNGGCSCYKELTDIGLWWQSKKEGSSNE